MHKPELPQGGKGRTRLEETRSEREVRTRSRQEPRLEDGSLGTGRAKAPAKTADPGRRLRTETENECEVGSPRLGGLRAGLMVQEVRPKRRPKGWAVQDGRLTDAGRRPIPAGMTFIKVSRLGQQSAPPRNQRPLAPPAAACAEPQGSLPDPQGWSKPQAAAAHPFVSGHKETTEWKNN